MKKPKERWSNRKIFILFCIYALSPFLLLLTLLVLNPLYNNFRMWQFERRFLAISHPPQSKFVTRTQEVGLFGNGNHCDFLVAEARSFSGSPNLVRNFYRKTRVAVPNSADDGDYVKNGTQPVEVEFLPSPLPKNYRWKFGYAEGLDLSSAAGKKNLYVVCIVNSGESYSWDSLCDWRCT